MISVQSLFGTAGLSECGPINWGESVPAKVPGVYVIVAETNDIVYIGRASRSISKRIQQFYRQKYGAKSPHRGGQEILKLAKPLKVYWAPAENFAEAESKMIAEFCHCENQLPYGNKIGGLRLRDQLPRIIGQVPDDRIVQDGGSG